MDIYEYGKEINFNADYYDFRTGRIYHLQEYGKALKTANDPEADSVAKADAISVVDNGIKVSENGVLIGYAKKVVD